MTLAQLDEYFRSVLDIAGLAKIDNSLNGLQVGRGKTELARLAFGVDAGLETFKRAAEREADLLFVHHGLFWGRDLAVTGLHYRRLRFLIEHDLALYAAHLPLDMHPELGNNAGLARALGLTGVSPFGNYKGVDIGVRGRLPEPKSLDEIVALLYGENPRLPGLLPFGKKLIESVGIVSGGAPYEVAQAIEAGLDLYLTGDASHGIYHQCLEAGINVIFGGHYLTETWGARLLAERTAKDTGLETVFIDLPTGF